MEILEKFLEKFGKILKKMPLLGGECLVSNIESENSRNREYRIVSESADVLSIGIAQQ